MKKCEICRTCKTAFLDLIPEHLAENMEKWKVRIN